MDLLARIVVDAAGNGDIEGAVKKFYDFAALFSKQAVDPRMEAIKARSGDNFKYMMPLDIYALIWDNDKYDKFINNDHYANTYIINSYFSGADSGYLRDFIIRMYTSPLINSIPARTGS